MGNSGSEGFAAINKARAARKKAGQGKPSAAKIRGRARRFKTADRFRVRTGAQPF